MEDKKPVEKTNPLSDGELDAVTGGAGRGKSEESATCRRCNGTFAATFVPGGYCINCRKEMAKSRVNPPI